MSRIIPHLAAFSILLILAAAMLACGGGEGPKELDREGDQATGAPAPTTAPQTPATTGRTAQATHATPQHRRSPKQPPAGPEQPRQRLSQRQGRPSSPKQPPAGPEQPRQRLSQRQGRPSNRGRHVPRLHRSQRQRQQGLRPPLGRPRGHRSPTPRLKRTGRPCSPSSTAATARNGIGVKPGRGSNRSESGQASLLTMTGE